VSGLAGDPAYPPKQPPMPPLPLGKSGTRFAHAMNQLGWHWWPSDTSVATTEYDGRAPCINLGHCTPACAQGAKASTDITYWPHAIRAGVELRTRCRVREITVDAQGTASGVVYYDADGREVFQPAHVVVLACNGVGTPRLLLNSVSGEISERAGEFLGPGWPEPDAASLAGGGRLCRRGGRRLSRPAAVHVEQAVLRDRPGARVRPWLHAAVRPRHRAGERAIGSTEAGPPA